MSYLTPGECKALDNLASVPGTWGEDGGPLKLEEYLMLAGYRATYTVLQAAYDEYIQKANDATYEADAEMYDGMARGVLFALQRLKEHGE